MAEGFSLVRIIRRRGLPSAPGKPLAKRAWTVYKYRYGGPMTEELTPTQQKILNFVRKTVQKTGFPPTRTEIAEAFGYSSANAAQEHLRTLERKGAIELTPSASRVRCTASRSPSRMPASRMLMPRTFSR